MATNWLTRIGKAVETTRERRGWKALNLADRTRELGAPIHRVALGKLEKGEKSSLTVEELVGLAAALGVPPVSLLFPPDEPTAETELLPGRPMSAYQAYGWFIGAGGSLGIREGWGYAPEGISTDRSMAAVLQILDLDEQIYAARNSLQQASAWAEKLDAGLIDPTAAEVLSIGDDSQIEQLRERIEKLEHAKSGMLSRANGDARQSD